LALLGFAIGGIIIFPKTTPAENELSEHCAANAHKLDTFAQGEVAAFVPARKPRMLPDISFHGIDGEQKDLRAFRGKVILLNLWASWCVPCRSEMPQLDALQEKRGSAAFSVVAISLDADGFEKPRAFFKEIKIHSLDFFHDAQGGVFPALRKAGFLAGLPSSFLIDKEGCLLGTLSGPANWADKDALALIDAATRL
jgi:thiol-disulfide isomerase/thioredoxin